MLAPARAALANDDVYRYRGADREQRLIDGARKEARVVVYTSLAPSESGPLARAFEAKTGIKVELWRALSEKVVQRAVSEARRRDSERSTGWNGLTPRLADDLLRDAQPPKGRQGTAE